MHRWAITLLGSAALLAPATVVAQPEEAYTVPGNAPVLGRSAIVQVTQGRVLVRLPDEDRYRPLSHKLEALPMGSFFDARRGRLSIRVMRRANSERTWRAEFHGGKFQLTQQPESPWVTDLRLAGGFAAACGDEDGASTSARKRKRKRVRSLWGDGKGRFRTSGRYSAATVRGTRWLVADRCDGTLTRVARGEVEVEDYTQGGPENTPQSSPEQPASGEDQAAPQERARGRSHRVGRGGSYVARPEN